MSNVLNYFDQATEAGDNVANLGGTVNLSGTVNDTSTLYSTKQVQTLLTTVTLAQSNAGITILPAVDGKTISVVGFDAKVSGNYADTTSILVQDTNDTPVVIATLAVAALTTGNIIDSKTANVTMGAGFLGALTEGKGIAVANSGDDATGGTSITFKIDYVIS